MEKYNLVVVPKSAASRTLSQLQPPLRKRFWEKLEEFCADINENSLWATYYAPKLGQVFQFKMEVEGSTFHVTVVFKFADSRDENTLLVSDILLREI